MSDPWSDYDARTRGKVVVRLADRLGDILQQEPVWVHRVWEGSDGMPVRLVIATGGSARDVAVKVVAEAAGLDGGDIGVHTRNRFHQMVCGAYALVGVACIVAALVPTWVALTVGTMVAAGAAAAWGAR